MTPPPRNVGVALRRGVPTIEEGRAFARYLDIAAEGFFRFLLGPAAPKIIAQAYIEKDNDFSHTNVLFAVQDDEIVGMASGFTSAQKRSFSDQALKQAAGRQRLRLALISTLLAPMLRELDKVDDGDFYLLSIATDSNRRGSGIGSMLIDAMERRAAEAACRRIVLDVAGTNEGARRLYERRGMRVASRWPRRVAVPKMTFYRLAKPL